MINITGVISIFKRLWLIEKYKYGKKGLKNIVIGYFILYLFFFHFSTFLRSIWPEKVENPKLLQAFLSPVLIFVMSVSYSLLYLPGYLGVSFYKKYQIESNNKWPWERENWAEMKKKTIINYVIIYFVMNPIFYIFLALIAKDDSLNTKI